MMGQIFEIVVTVGARVKVGGSGWGYLPATETCCAL